MYQLAACVDCTEFSVAGDFIPFLIAVVYCQVDPDLRRLCNFAVSCRECILADPACVWCADTVSF